MKHLGVLTAEIHQTPALSYVFSYKMAFRRKCVPGKGNSEVEDSVGGTNHGPTFLCSFPVRQDIPCSQDLDRVSLINYNIKGLGSTPESLRTR